jgi:hypothetical protein
METGESCEASAHPLVRKESLMERPITEEPETLEEAYERVRIESLSEQEQYLLYLHVLDQFEAVPSYVEQQAKQFAQEKE